FAEAETGDVPPQRVPWARPGWYAEASAWITAHLGRLNLAVNGPLVQRRSWATSCILKVDTPSGDIYFKAVSAPFAHEPPLLAALTAWYPAHLPPVLAMDRERGWLLTGGVGDVVLDKVTELVRWEEALAVFAELQIGLVKKRGYLVALGCPERPLRTLAAQLTTLLAEWRNPTFARSQVSNLALLCEELADCGVPDTLEHGDFWPGNIFLSDGRYIYLDWSNSSLAHPFFSLASFFYYVENYRPDLPPEVSARLRDAYLMPWTIFASKERLQQAFSLALVLAGLHHAITYQCYILPRLEPEARWEVAMAVPYYIQQMLRHMAGII
ncbi:MAG: phosphotransferase, partial [Chloroflexi bacterium]|nr:phosphotransferase [Chloroflexota bacterium]